MSGDRGVKKLLTISKYMCLKFTGLTHRKMDFEQNLKITVNMIKWNKL